VNFYRAGRQGHKETLFFAHLCDLGGEIFFAS